MSSRFLLQFLGFWLLMSQPCGAQVTSKWLDEVIKVCGREYVRATIDICGRTLNMVDMEVPAPRQRRPAREAVPSFINKDAEPLSTVLEPKAAPSEGHPSLPDLQQSVPALSDSVGSLESFKQSFYNMQGEAEDSSPVKRWDTHSRKKRDYTITLSDRCCSLGCTRRAIAKRC
ncbi:prorelaxin H2 [Sigmodon hispidus]